MKTNAIHHMWRATLAGLAIACALLPASVGAAEAVPNQTPQSLQTSAQVSGTTWKTVPTQTITADGISFIKAKGLKQVDLLGFSMGGMIAQEMVLKDPNQYLFFT